LIVRTLRHLLRQLPNRQPEPILRAKGESEGLVDAES